jgi:hypothetical protein
VKFAALIAASVLLCGCAVTREQAIAAATREVHRDRPPLPRGYTVRAEKGSFLPSHARPEPGYCVTFHDRSGREIYYVLVGRDGRATGSVAVRR